MSIYRVIPTNSTTVNFAPQTEEEEILQNVRTILATRVGTVPLHRDFGLTWEHIDMPLLVSQSQMMVAIVDAITEFEPRAKVRSVTFDESDAVEGILKPVVTVSIGDDEEEEV